PSANGSRDLNQWGRYIAGVSGVTSDINITGTAASSPGLYQVTVETPRSARQGGGASTSKYSATGQTADVNSPCFDCGKLPPCAGRTPNICQVVAIDQSGLKSVPFTRTHYVLPMPRWLSNQVFRTQSIGSTGTYGPSKSQSNLSSHAVGLKLDKTVNQ